MRISEWSSDVCSSDLSRLLQKFPRYRTLKKESQHMSKIYLWALVGLSCLLTACSGDMNCEDDEVIDTIRQIIAEHTNNGAACRCEGVKPGHSVSTKSIPAWEHCDTRK